MNGNKLITFYKSSVTAVTLRTFRNKRASQKLGGSLFLTVAKLMHKVKISQRKLREEIRIDDAIQGLL